MRARKSEGCAPHKRKLVKKRKQHSLDVVNLRTLLFVTPQAYGTLAADEVLSVDVSQQFAHSNFIENALLCVEGLVIIKILRLTKR
jgi:hypothetical protein